MTVKNDVNVGENGLAGLAMRKLGELIGNQNETAGKSAAPAVTETSSDDVIVIHSLLTDADLKYDSLSPTEQNMIKLTQYTRQVGKEIAVRMWETSREEAAEKAIYESFSPMKKFAVAALQFINDISLSYASALIDVATVVKNKNAFIKERVESGMSAKDAVAEYEWLAGGFKAFEESRDYEILERAVLFKRLYETIYMFKPITIDEFTRKREI